MRNAECRSCKSAKPDFVSERLVATVIRLVSVPQGLVALGAS